MIFIRGEAREEGAVVRAQEPHYLLKKFFCTREKGHIFHLVPQGRIRTSGTKCGCFTGTIAKENAFRGTGPESIGSPHY